MRTKTIGCLVGACTLFFCGVVHGSAAELTVGTRVRFSQLDGSASDEDGAVDGVLTVARLTVKDRGHLVIDVPSAMIKSAGDVVLLGQGIIGSDSSSLSATGPCLTIASEGSISLAGATSIATPGTEEGGKVQLCALRTIQIGGNASVRADAVGPQGRGGLVRLQAGPIDGLVQAGGSTLISASASSGGGRILVCATGDVQLSGNIAVRANGEAGGPGGTIEVQAQRNLLVAGQSASIQVNGGSGGLLRLVSCGPASTAPDGVNSIQLHGRSQALGLLTTGGTVDVVASGAGILFPGVSNKKQPAIQATGVTAPGTITITAATSVTPLAVTTQPPATVRQNSPTNASCQCGNLAILIDSPVSGEVTAADGIDVRGSVSGASEVMVNGVAATVLGNAFFAAGVPLNEGTNVLTASAQDDQNQFVSDSVSVRRDTDPPLVVIETPRGGDRLIQSMIDVAGTVNDIIPGANVNEDDVSVMVNGMPAPVHNRSFFLAGLPLQLGTNTIQAVAVDRVGNTSSSSIQVTREPDLAGIHLFISSGNAQRAPIQATLPIPLEVLLTDNDGMALAGRPIMFDVSRGDGLLGDPSENLRSRTLLTDMNGMAEVGFTIGSRTGEGFHRVRATTPGSLASVEFCATATSLPPEKITIVMMTPRTWIAGQELTDPLTVIVTDSGGNPVSGVPVDFLVTAGGGNFRGEPSVEIPTNLDGIAQAFWTLGPDAGQANNE